MSPDPKKKTKKGTQVTISLIPSPVKPNEKNLDQDACPQGVISSDHKNFWATPQLKQRKSTFNSENKKE